MSREPAIRLIPAAGRDGDPRRWLFAAAILAAALLGAAAGVLNSHGTL